MPACDSVNSDMYSTFFGGISLYDYDMAKDVARIPLRLRTMATPMESLTMSVVPAPATSGLKGELRIWWGSSELSAEWMVM